MFHLARGLAASASGLTHLNVPMALGALACGAGIVFGKGAVRLGCLILAVLLVVGSGILHH